MRVRARANIGIRVHACTSVHDNMIERQGECASVCVRARIQVYESIRLGGGMREKNKK